MVIGQVWESLRDKLEGETRWMKVKGPIGAVVATLYSAGWTLGQPDKWQDPEGETWAIDYNSPEVIGDLQEAIDLHYDKKM